MASAFIQKFFCLLNCGAGAPGDAGVDFTTHVDDVIHKAEGILFPVYTPPDGARPFVEKVTERIGGVIIASSVREATEKDIAEAKAAHAAGQCPHNIVFDTEAYMYDSRTCFVCGHGMGVV